MKQRLVILSEEDWLISGLQSEIRLVSSRMVEPVEVQVVKTWEDFISCFAEGGVFATVVDVLGDYEDYFEGALRDAPLFQNSLNIFLYAELDSNTTSVLHEFNAMGVSRKQINFDSLMRLLFGISE